MTTTLAPSDIFTTGEAATELGIHYFQLDRFIRNGKIISPMRSHGGARRFYTADMIEVVKHQVDALSAGRPVRGKDGI